jgi:hypothetical protein
VYAEEYVQRFLNLTFARDALLVTLLTGPLALQVGCRGQAPTPGPAERAARSVPAPRAAEPAADEPVPSHVRAQGQLGPGAGVLLIDLAAPEGAKLTLDAPMSARGSGGIGLGFPLRLTGPLGQQSMPLRLPVQVEDGATGPAQVELSYYWCTEGNEAACRRELALLTIDLDLTGSGDGGEAHLSHRARAN